MRHRVTTTIAVLVLSAACAPTMSSISSSVSASVLDFRRHTTDGFFFSPDPYVLPHTALGIVSVSAYAGASRAAIPDRVGSVLQVDSIAPDSVLALAKTFARGLGGDAVVNLEVERVFRRETGYPLLPGWEVRGLVVRREPR